MSELLEDLRVFIGAFFVVAGGTLLALAGERSKGAPDLSLNAWTGAAFVAFGIAAVAAAVMARRSPSGPSSKSAK